MKHKVLLLGSTGFLGSVLVKFVPKNIKLWLAFKDKPLENHDYKSVKIDLLDYKSLIENLRKIKPDIIIHVARLSPDDENPKRAKEAMEQLVKIIRQIGAKLVYLSSDAVFDGKKGNYKETDKTNPLTNYGKAKLATETVIRKNLKNFIIIRTSYIYGKGINGWDKRTSQLLDKIKQGKAVYRFKDMRRSPIQAADLAKAIWQLVEKEYNGIIHIAGKRKNIYQFSREVIKALSLDPNLIKADFLTDKKINIAPDTSLNTNLAIKVIEFLPK